MVQFPKLPSFRRSKSVDDVNYNASARITPSRTASARSTPSRTGRTPRRLRFRSKSPKHEMADDSATSATSTMDSSTESGPGLRRRPPLLQRNFTHDGCTTTATAEPTMSKEQLARHNRLKELPNCANFSSNHILVNRERMRLNKKPLHRSRDLDAIARQRAEEMAQDKQLQARLQIESMAENIQRGPSIRLIHQMMMAGVDDVSRNNILSEKFHRFGVGCAMGDDGMIYMSQIFQAPAVFSEELKSHAFNSRELEEEESKELFAISEG